MTSSTTSARTAPSAHRTAATIPTSLVANPSHLEAVDPVLEGVVRAKQDVIDKGEPGFTVLPVLIHGDAAFAGQGVVAETLNLSLLRGYRTGGTMHIIVNNQVGFTTAPQYSRSSVYATDVARMIQAPIFHVNGDDPEAVVRIARLAFDYRQAFKKDVVIDMVLLPQAGAQRDRQPVLHPAAHVRPGRGQALDQEGVHRVADRPRRHHHGGGRGGAARLPAAARAGLHRDQGRGGPPGRAGQRDPARAGGPPGQPRGGADRGVRRGGQADHRHAGQPARRLHPAPAAQAADRPACHDGREDAIDWATGELLAFGAVVLDGHPVRLVGQDSRRGTFGQRHAVLVDRHNGAEYTPLKQLESGAAKFFVHDSLLSEFAAMGFEYGYSLARPDALVCWEAQFGDFFNGGQTIVDEFISSGEQKWGQRSGVVLLLPHGYDGQGPDHSSARIERFLTLCAEDNMTVATPTTPGNYFHLLRWQGLSGRHKPLIVFTPKSMLRLKAATSAVAEFTSGSFQPLIGSAQASDADIRRVLLCSGKIYYDLAARREQVSAADTAIARVERLYPLPVSELAAELARYPGLESVTWVQEEPANMGGWPTMALKLPRVLGRQVDVLSLPASSAPAAGSAKKHATTHREIIEKAIPSGR